MLSISWTSSNRALFRSKLYIKMKKDKNLKILEKYLSSSINNMSSYGREHLLNADFYNIETGMNSGNSTKLNTKIKFKYYLSLILQFLIFKSELITNSFMKEYKKMCKKQNRLFNHDLIIHSIVLRILNDYKVLRGNVCTIGDGKANFVHGLLNNKKINKIFSVNLPQSLIQDYLIIKKYNSLDMNLVKIVENNQDIDGNYKLFLIPAENKKILLKRNIDLFVNMVSFQEMPLKETHEYINIIKSNNAFLYSLNSEEKIMYDKTKINYYDYGIEKSGKIIFEEQANFYKYFYNGSFPFIHKKMSKIISTLAKL